jgi:hypothetical protein
MMQTKAAPQFESECICRREESETTGLEAYWTYIGRLKTSEV